MLNKKNTQRLSEKIAMKKNFGRLLSTANFTKKNRKHEINTISEIVLGKTIRKIIGELSGLMCLRLLVFLTIQLNR